MNTRSICAVLRVLLPVAVLIASAVPDVSAATVTVEVGLNGDMYTPKTVNIQSGDTVKWVWRSNNHSVTSGTPDAPTNQFDSKIRDKDATFSRAFTAAGTVQYHCGPHGGCCQMIGTINVAAATPTPTPTATPTPTPTPARPLPDVQTGVLRIELDTIATGLTAPTDLVAAPGDTNRLFVVGQGGVITVIKNQLAVATPFLDVTDRMVTLNPNYDERGLLGMAFHPGFNDPSNPGFRKLYTYTSEPITRPADFTVPNVNAHNHQSVVAEWLVSENNPDVVNPASRREVMRIDQPQFNHNGGKIAFRPSDGKLYIALGDGGAANDVGAGHNPATGNAQDITNVLGKILRIDPLDPTVTNASSGAVSANGKYRVPNSNPFVGKAGVDEIYSYGFRNPFRFSFDELTDKFIVADVGQNNVEEIDVVEAGKNYGWNRKEGSFLFNPADGSVSPDPSPDASLIDPIAEYGHQDGTAVMGGFVYRGTAVHALHGKYVFGELTKDFTAPGGRLFFLDGLTPGPVQEFRLGNNNRKLGVYVKGIGQDQAGEIYVLTDSNIGPSGTTGKVLKIVEPPPSPALLNVSTRLNVGTGENVLIGGFIVVGSTSKPVILRGIGPSLKNEGQPLPGRLADPFLELHGSNGVIATNDDWVNSPNKQQIIDSGIEPPDEKESAVFAALPPGAYTAVLRSTTSENGIGLVELYDADQSTAANAVNISTRGVVQTGNGVMIGGFIVGGNRSRTFVTRAMGPSLAGPDVSSPLANPMLKLHNSSGTVVASNDDWKSSGQAQQIRQTGLAPQSEKESAVLTTLAPGDYTAVVSGAGNSSGVALVEVYQIE